MNNILEYEQFIEENYPGKGSRWRNRKWSSQDKKDFDTWMVKVDKILMKKYRLKHDDFGDYLWADAFTTDVKPESAVSDMIKMTKYRR